jgi:hypothetical protein
MLEDEEPDVKSAIRKQADVPAQRTVNTMSSEKGNPMIMDSDLSRRARSGNGFYEQAGVNFRRHAVCSEQEKAVQALEREEVAVRWVVIFFIGFVVGLSVLGLVRGFALTEATILFPAILALSTLWMLSSWGERSSSSERGV